MKIVIGCQLSEVSESRPEDRERQEIRRNTRAYNEGNRSGSRGTRNAQAKTLAPTYGRTEWL